MPKILFDDDICEVKNLQILQGEDRIQRFETLGESHYVRPRPEPTTCTFSSHRLPPTGREILLEDKMGTRVRIIVNRITGTIPGFVAHAVVIGLA